ncbi:hypothetical protein ACFPL7_11515 [Dongia soli]|uniref:YD repeat-containing protein n=1 Tax=Dongia soli TaxID=600628 RepID=A0ABU5EBC1_9PROT|nr:hypothetical protein [Dongia soli]MDY0883577.1 hypothetical protein [Dongia soli]
MTSSFAPAENCLLRYSTKGQTRVWTFNYTSSGQLLSAQLPRLDVAAKTSFG